MEAKRESNVEFGIKLNILFFKNLRKRRHWAGGVALFILADNFLQFNI